MEDETSPQLSESDVFALLSHRRRRLVIRILQNFPLPLTADEIATLVGECEYDDPSDDRLEVITLSLYHKHLPKLEDAGVVAWDRDDGIVQSGPNFGVLIGELEDASERDGAFAGQ